MKIDEILVRYSPLIEWICTRKYRLEKEDMEDVRQDVLIGLYKYKDYLESQSEEKVRSFVGYRTNYKCVDLKRFQKHRNIRPPEFFYRFSAPKELLDTGTKDLLKLLLQLTSKKNKKILEDYYLKNKSLEDLSKKYKIKENTLYRRIHKALSDIRSKTLLILKEFGDE